MNWTELLNEAYMLKKTHIEPISSGVMNQNFLVQTLTGEKYVLKSYATNLYQPSWIRRVYQMQEVVAKANVPVPHVVLNRQGEAITETNDGFFVLSEFVDGCHYERPHIPATAAYSMGQTLGRMQIALQSLPDVTPFQWPAYSSSALQLEELVKVAKRKRSDSEVDERCYHVLLEKLDLLEEVGDVMSRLPKLRSQWVHGDYQETNLIFDAQDHVIAVLDFDHLRERPRAMELMRALVLPFFTGDALLPEAFDFFTGYAEVVDVQEEEIAAYVPMWRYYHLTNHWPIQTRLLHPEDYDSRWDRFIGTNSGWWEQHEAEVTERLQEVLALVRR